MKKLGLLIIGHRGAAGLELENTLAAMHAGMRAGAAMLEFDVRLTSDGVPVIIHDASTLRTHHKHINIGHTTLIELQAATKAAPIPTLEEVLDEFFGKVKLNIELKGKDSGEAAVKLVLPYIKQPQDWNHVIFTSFHTNELVAARRASDEAPLGMLNWHNPFAFVAHEKRLRLSAVGFHKLVVNPLAIAIAKKRGLFTYAYTVNRVATARLLAKEGIEGIVTNRPDIFKEV